jgi:transposase
MPSPREGRLLPTPSRPPARDLIHKKFGVLPAVRIVGGYLERWGYTAKRPTRHTVEQDPEDVRQWLRETYSAIE